MQGNIEHYLAYGSVKSAWVTLFITAIILGVLYVIRPLVSDDSDVSDIEAADKRSGGGFLSRINTSYNAMKDNAFYHLIALCLNSFGMGSTKALSILSWIYFIINVIYGLGLLFIDHKIIRGICNLIFFVLVLIMYILAFKEGGW
ncbi:uncharacterized protein BX663DRAFT_500987 [Cokeromyces recurvatus]|uniref:uncharacterized protein n=1 Tax=Cokeromyces recurvatus TaxID=90255 RepID=UPI002220307F|nr:uncharacterized protein BX663DRAFT_500987 [Cokeromyces recurvatus]KAI7905811.1 hypothetical protein BX663DRAFT_500987 [Cokeromyces recurvatus]